MWSRESNKVKGDQRFFIINLSHDNLVNHYKTNFSLMQHHNYSLADIETMMPWEREIYVAMLVEWVKEENDRIKQEQMKYGQ